MKLKVIYKDGKTRVVDAATNEALEGVRSVEFVGKGGGGGFLTLGVTNFEMWIETNLAEAIIDDVEHPDVPVDVA